MADLPGNEAAADLAAAIESLVALDAVVRFHDGRVRLGCTTPDDPDGRVVVVEPSDEQGVCAALIRGAARLATDHQAARRWPVLQLVR